MSRASDPLPRMTLRQAIFATAEDGLAHAILDGASLESLSGMLARHALEAVCLLPGELTPELAAAAPYLVVLEAQAPSVEGLLNEVWGRHGALFAISRANTRALRQHFRDLLTVYDARRQPLFFRYYDPRVLRLYLPTCQPEELARLFGPIDRLLCEDEDAGLLWRYEYRAGTLDARHIALI